MLLIGTEIKEGEKVAPDRIVTVKIDGQPKSYRRLSRGDKVEEGQLLARLDDRLARAELRSKKAKLESANADLKAADKTVQEAKARWERDKQAGASAVEVRISNVTYEKCRAEVVSKKKAIDVAQVELDQAQVVLEIHEIRSSVSG